MKECTVATTTSVSLESNINQITYLSTLLKTNPVSTSGSTRPIFVPNVHTNPALVKRMITPKDYSKVNPKVKKKKKNLVMFPKMKTKLENDSILGVVGLSSSSPLDSFSNSLLG